MTDRTRYPHEFIIDCLAVIVNCLYLLGGVALMGIGTILLFQAETGGMYGMVFGVAGFVLVALGVSWTMTILRCGHLFGYTFCSGCGR